MTGGSHARVVIGLPVHNSERFLRDTLASVAAQDYPHLEVVISDDASTDGTLAICREYVTRDPRFRVVRHAERVGWIANYNSLLPHARGGDYFLWVPHDDLYDPAYVGTLVALLEARPDAVLAYSTTLGFDATGRVVTTWSGNEALHRATTPLARGLRYLWWHEEEEFIPFRGIVRSAAIRAVGGLEVGPWEIFADDLWLFRLALVGGFVHDARPLCRKRLYRGSVSTLYRYTYRQRNAYLAAHRRLVRAAGLGWRTTYVLLVGIALRQACVALWWLSCACGRGIEHIVPTGRLRWYASPAELPRRLRKLLSRLRGSMERLYVRPWWFR
jgi:glycosyltransferase involved in cell wall biosynthesis